MRKGVGFFQPECNDHDVHLPDHAEMYGTVQRFFGICGQNGEDTDHDRGNRVGEYFRAEYGLCMVLLVTVFYVFDTRNVLKTVLGCIISLMYVTGPIAFYGIWCYNGVRKDRINKYVYYAFYPLHLLVLGVIAKFVL